MFGDSRSMSLALDRYLTTPPDWDDEAEADDYDNIANEPDDTPTPDAPPTAEELAQEAAYYAALDAQQQREALSDAMWAALITPDAGDVDDDGGYCGPTCGKYGNW